MILLEWLVCNKINSNPSHYNQGYWAGTHPALFSWWVIEQALTKDKWIGVQPSMALLGKSERTNQKTAFRLFLGFERAGFELASIERRRFWAVFEERGVMRTLWYVNDEWRRRRPQSSRPYGKLKNGLFPCYSSLACHKTRHRRRALKSPHFWASQFDVSSNPALLTRRTLAKDQNML